MKEQNVAENPEELIIGNAANNFGMDWKQENTHTHTTKEVDIFLLPAEWTNPDTNIKQKKQEVVYIHTTFFISVAHDTTTTTPWLND